MSVKIKILEPQGFSQVAIDTLSNCGQVEVSSELKKGSEEANILFVRLKYQLDKDFLQNFPSLQYIVSPTTGEDHVDRNYINSVGIELLSLKGEIEFLKTIPSTAEFTWGLLLSLYRNIPQSIASVNNGYWDRDSFKGRNLLNKTVALLGFGRVAQIVSRYAEAFGLTVKAYDPYVDARNFPDYVLRCSSLNELVCGADILSVHTSLTGETIGLVGQEEIDSLADGAVVINTARGEIVNSEALLFSLKSGKLFGAAIDVLPEERCESELKTLLLQYARSNKNLLITPHLAGASFESMAMTEEFMAQKLINRISKD